MNDREELEARLAKARSERVARVAAREEREELAKLRAEVDAEERAILDEDAIAKAEAEHGPVGSKIRVVHTDAGSVIVKRPAALVFRRFMDAGSTKTLELEKLVRHCLVYPDVPAFDRLLEEYPAALVSIADACAELAGARGKEVSGK